MISVKKRTAGTINAPRKRGKKKEEEEWDITFLFKLIKVTQTNCNRSQRLPKMKKLKILGLHGHSTSGAILKKELQVWPSNVLEMMDFVFINAPFPRHDLPIPGFSWFEDSTEVQHLFNNSNQLHYLIFVDNSIAIHVHN